MERENERSTHDREEPSVKIKWYMAIVTKKAKEKKSLDLSKDSYERSTTKIKLLKYIDIVNKLQKDIITIFFKTSSHQLYIKKEDLHQIRIVTKSYFSIKKNCSQVKRYSQFDPLLLLCYNINTKS